MTSGSQNILLCHSGHAYSEELFMMGIRRFAMNRPAWEIGYALPGEIESKLPEILEKWNPQGILGVHSPRETPKLFSLSNPPVVFVDPAVDCPETVSTVRVNHRAIGARAAEYFIRKRFREVAVVSQRTKPPYSELRREGFHQRMNAEGITPHEFQLRSNYARPWHEFPDLEAWLRELPHPVGIFCIRDSFAQQISRHARQAGLRVPGDLSVLGAGDHEVICESVRPRLSSIPGPVEECGFHAAQLLDTLMETHAATGSFQVVHHELEPGVVVERQSTSLSAIPDRKIAIAANFLLEQTLQGGTIAEAVREAGLNRKALERGFIKYLGVTPGVFMTEIRLDQAKRLLSTTDLRMWEIADACGLTQNHFSYLFRTTFGMTPNAYRKKVRAL